MNGPFIRLRMLAADYFVSSQSTRLTDGRTDGQKERRQQYRAYAFAVAR